MNEHSGSPVLRSPWTFFLTTFAWTWFIWALAIAFGFNMETAGGFLLLLLGVMGPMVNGIAFTYLTYGREGRRDYWRRITDFRRIGVTWYLVILLFAPILNVLAALLDVLLGGGGATWGEAALKFLVAPLSIIPSILFATLIPFIEELGWRGYVLDRLQARWSALISTLILGTVWAVWHLPLFFIEGTYQADLGAFSPEFWLFMAGIVPLSFAFTWIYNNTNRSTLAVILFHGMVNFTGEVIAITRQADAYATGLWFVAAIAIVLTWGAQTFTTTQGSLKAS